MKKKMKKDVEIECDEEGKNIMIEKKMEKKVEEWREIIDEEKKEGVKIMNGNKMRLKLNLMDEKRIKEEGEIGNMRYG